MLYRRLSNSLPVLFLILLFAGCSSGERVAKVPDTLRRSLSAHPVSIVVDVTNEVFRLYGYDIQRREVDNKNLYYQTDWKVLTALEDERATGHQLVEVQLLITGRPRGTAEAQRFTTTFQAFVRNQSGDPIVMTPQRQSELMRLVDELNEKLMTGRIR